VCVAIYRVGIRQDSKFYVQEQFASLDKFVTMRSGMLGSFLALLILSYIVLFLPMVRSLDLQLKQVRCLLVMVPNEVAEAVPSLRALLMPLTRLAH